jgi:hypothetical protein
MVVEEEARHGGVAMVVGVVGRADAGIILEAFWFETFLLIAGQKNYVFLLKDTELLGMCISPRITTHRNLEGLHLCSLWSPMRLLKLSII